MPLTALVFCSSLHVQRPLGSSPTALCPPSRRLASLCSACCHYGNLCEDALQDEDALWDEDALRDVVTAAAFCSGTGDSIRTEAAWGGEMGGYDFPPNGN